MRATNLWIALSICAGLAACGDTMGEQALYGAGAGAVGAAVLDGNVLGGAAVGAAGNVLYCQQKPGACS
ncbi:hypothetical protein [Sedimentitalea todarodis]|uniref:YMGG-like Gly-zipper domain-containing protein n=1 Tax=Sedimentitalea todarodis TaxID=1631240 RepID=A0ABU3VJE0_9RHOB|nr:hypothetical protein [Sedimentitalea todarodis]MDU9006306.1 hypothetical protein [Sedimentitalea todarodis]